MKKNIKKYPTISKKVDDFYKERNTPISDAITEHAFNIASDEKYAGVKYEYYQQLKKDYIQEKEGHLKAADNYDKKIKNIDKILKQLENELENYKIDNTKNIEDAIESIKDLAYITERVIKDSTGFGLKKHKIKLHELLLIADKYDVTLENILAYDDDELKRLLKLYAEDYNKL